MKVWIDRDVCQAHLSTCLSCLSQLAQTGKSERPCIMDYEQGNSKNLKVFTHSEGQDRTPFVIPQKLLDMIAHRFRDGVFAPKIELDL